MFVAVELSDPPRPPESSRPCYKDRAAGRFIPLILHLCESLKIAPPESSAADGFAHARPAPVGKNRPSASTPHACIFFVAWRTLSVHNDSSIG
jgi:hypothetical protein